MRKRLVRVLAVGAAGALALAGCGGIPGRGSSGPFDSSGALGIGKVGVILPDSTSSDRWEAADGPLLRKAFDTAGVMYDIRNAGGEETKFQAIADNMIAQKVNVLLIVNLDNETGAAVIRKAKAAGIPVIDYDRLTLGGGADYYVSFDNVAVGTAIGISLAKCLNEADVKSGGVVELNGSPTDNNATLFKQGYDKAIKDAGFTVVADRSVPKWDNTQAGTIFGQVFNQHKGRFVGVVSANDGLGGAVVSVLQRNGLAGKVPVTGQDATDEGLQRVLLGTQCVTVYKAIKKEADAASDLAIKMIKGDTAGADAAASGSVEDTMLKTWVKSVLLQPQAIYKDNVKDVIADGFTTKEKVCTTAELQRACTAAGIS